MFGKGEAETRRRLAEEAAKEFGRQAGAYRSDKPRPPAPEKRQERSSRICFAEGLGIPHSFTAEYLRLRSGTVIEKKQFLAPLVAHVTHVTLCFKVCSKV